MATTFNTETTITTQQLAWVALLFLGKIEQITTADFAVAAEKPERDHLKKLLQELGISGHIPCRSCGGNSPGRWPKVETDRHVIISAEDTTGLCHHCLPR